MNQDKYLKSWQERQELAEAMQPLLGKLFRQQGIEITVYGRPLLSATTIDIIKAHRNVRQHNGEKLRLRESFPLLLAIAELDIKHARLDLGKLAVKFATAHGSNYDLVEEFLKVELKEVHEREDTSEPRDVVLYGFGRIGRLLARLLIERSGFANQMRLRAIVVRGTGGDLEKRASLLRRDSIHGPFNGSIEVDESKNAIIANGNYIQIIYSNSPASIDYTTYGINNALIVDNTGKWTDHDGLSEHLKSIGTSKVLLTAPAKGDIDNIVYGVNEHMIGDAKIVSAASCTTNAITPVLKAINDKFGIINGHIESVHSYTNDQNLIDNYHPSPRRGRSAPLNMVITSTGAAKAVAKALPELAGKLSGNAIRVPTPNVSMAIMNLNLKQGTTTKELNVYLSQMALHSDLQDQIDFTTSSEVVSTDLVGSRYAGVVDSEATITSESGCILYVWYDNEFGYSCQVLRVMRNMLGLDYPTLPRA